MNRIPPYCLILCGLCILSCKNIANKTYKGIDTLQIISKVLTVKKKVKDLPARTDTVYILKSSKYYNSSWPKKVNNLNVTYIEDTERTRTHNEPWSKNHDGRCRFGIPKFNLKNDTGTVTLFGFNSLIDYNYILQKRDGEWVILKFYWGIQ